MPEVHIPEVLNHLLDTEFPTLASYDEFQKVGVVEPAVLEGLDDLGVDTTIVEEDLEFGFFTSAR